MIGAVEPLGVEHVVFCLGLALSAMFLGFLFICMCALVGQPKKPRGANKQQP